MNDEAVFQKAMLEHPEDNALRLVFADWLEERGDNRGELIRLLHTLTQSVEVPDRQKLEDRLRSLLADGVQPVGPFWTNSIGMKFAWIPAGTFLMGSPEDEEGREENETQHKVTLTNGFWLGIHEVTYAVWQAVMGDLPELTSQFEEEKNRNIDDLPAVFVSWDQCQTFLSKLGERDNHLYRLPTEAEWEFACRAGTTTPYHFGITITKKLVNFCEGKVYETTAVGSYPSNAFSLFDMHGNVWEWCADWYQHQCGPSEVIDFGNPGNEAPIRDRVVRGGSHIASVQEVRSAHRIGFPPDSEGNILGFRVATTLEPRRP